MLRYKWAGRCADADLMENLYKKKLFISMIRKKILSLQPL